MPVRTIVDGNRTVGLASVLLLALGTMTAFSAVALGLELGAGGVVLACVALAGIPLGLLGWQRDTAPSPNAAPRGASGPARSPADIDLSQRLQAVVNAGEGLVMVFQPIIDLRDGSRVGHEALARFPDARPPNEWFDEAHAVGVGVELEMCAIERAVAEFDGVGGYLSINLSPPTLTSEGFVPFISSRADATKLVLELTEHAVIEDYAEIRSALEALRSIGAKIAVDDAGSGISSMRHILTIAPDIIKLDRSLISTIDSDPARRALALSLAQFASEIGADLVAEGVERAAEMNACYESGVRYGQGYLLGRPGPIGG